MNVQLANAVWRNKQPTTSSATALSVVLHAERRDWDRRTEPSDTGVADARHPSNVGGSRHTQPDYVFGNRVDHSAEICMNVVCLRKYNLSKVHREK